MRGGDLAIRQARDTTTQGRSHTQWQSQLQQTTTRRAPGLALTFFSLFPFCLCPYGESDSEELSPSV